MSTSLEPQVPAAGRDRGAGPLRVALAGFGTVGRAVARALVETPPSGPLPVELVCIFDRHVDRKREGWVPARVAWTDQVDRVFADDVDVVVELVGGLGDARAWVERALDSGRPVVTANKQLVAEHGPALEARAAATGAALRFEAAVCGGVPVVNAIRTGLRGDAIHRLAGVLNGTANHVLTAMERDGRSLDAALAEAVEQGLAEADPSADLGGDDARAKLRILAREALGVEVEAGGIPCAGLDGLAGVDFRYGARLGCTIRQVAWIGRDGGRVVGAVGPMLVPRTSPLASVAGRDNLLITWGRRAGPTRFAGRGAGGDATAVAVVSDLLQLATRGANRQPAAPAVPAVPAVPVALDGDGALPRYLRVTVSDRPGILAALAGAFGRRGINVDAVLQEPGYPKAGLPFVVTLEACAAGPLDRALDDIRAADFHVVPPLALPIFDCGQDPIPLRPEHVRAGTTRSDEP